MGDSDRADSKWPVGSALEVEWIRTGTRPGLEITSALPPIFEAYGTVVIPERHRTADHAYAVAEALRSESPSQHWWLGFLDIGDPDRYLPIAPEIDLYSSWRYRLVQAEPAEALTLRAEDTFKWALPDLVFPADRAWLLSTLWDDDWSCIGGSRSLIDRLTAHALLDARKVQLGQDATPPGHTAI